MEITLICEVDEELSVRDLSEFLVDLAFLYDRCVMLKENPHQPILYNPDFYRRWRRLPRGLELKIRKISKDSPLEIALIINPLTFEIFRKFLELIRDWHTEKERRELENLKRKIEILKEAENLPPELLPLIERDLKRLLGSSIKVREIKSHDLKSK